MALGQGVLSGKKTYIAAVLAILGTLGSYLAGDVGITDAAQLVLTAILGVTIRHGIASDTK